MRIKKSVILVGVGIGSLVVGYVGISALIFASNPDAARLRMLVPEVTLEPSNVFSQAHDDDIMRLYNHVGRKVKWSDADRDWVLNTLGSGWPDVEVDPNGDMYEAWQLLNSTITIVGERIGNGIETDGDVAEMYRETVIGMLDHPQGRVRQKGATAVALAGMLDDPDLRSVLEHMAENDPDDGARRSSGIKLRQHDGLKTAQDDCPTCPKGNAP